MMRLLITFLIFSLVTPSLTAECLKKVTKIEEGEPAPCSGFLFTPMAEGEVRIRLEEAVLIEEETKVKDRIIKVYKLDVAAIEEIHKKEREKAELWRVRAEDSTLKLVEAESGRGTRDIIFILLGIGLTVGAGFAVGQAGR